MKKVIALKGIDSSWAIQNRVESLQDWSLNGGACPFDIEVENNNATIFISDECKERYENPYQYESDMSMLNVFLKDIKDPLSAGDDFEFKEIDVDKADPTAKTEFAAFAQETCGSLACDYLNVLGLEVATKPLPSDESIEQNESVNRMELINKMMKESESVSLESDDNDLLGPDSPIEFYDSETDTMTASAPEPKAVDVPEEVHEKAEELLEEHSQNLDGVTDEEKQEAIKVVTANTIESDNVQPKPISELHADFIQELKDACDEYEITPKGLVAVVMSLKALANNTAKAKPINEISTESMSTDDYKSLRIKRYPLNLMNLGVTTTKKASELYKDIKSFNPHEFIDLGDNNKSFIDSINAKYIGNKFGLATFLQKDGKIGFIDNDNDSGEFDRTSTIEEDIIEENNASVEDVTGKEGYTYSDAVPYVQNPHEKEPEVDTQFINVGTESVNPLNSTESLEVISAEDVYNSLTNIPTGTLFEDISNESADVNDFAEIIDSDVSLEAFMSKRSKKVKDANQVVEDMKKICEDVKDIAAKSFKELRDRNTELFAKYGAFIKLLNDIVDAIFMDKHYVKLEIARFDVQKANNEIVPDKLEETIAKQFGKSILTSALGPFAGLAKDDSKPGNYLLIYANSLRKEILAHAKKDLSKYEKTVLTLVEDELKGSYVLTLAFAPLEVSNESEEKTYDSLLQQYAFESKTDDEFFDRVIANKNKFTFQEIMECSEFNMRNYYVNGGSKIKNNPVLTANRRTSYFKS